eukprot:2251786-Pleurochrysis_carterae.AAC.1
MRKSRRGYARARGERGRGERKRVDVSVSCEKRRRAKGDAVVMDAASESGRERDSAQDETVETGRLGNRWGEMHNGWVGDEKMIERAREIGISVVEAGGRDEMGV